MVYASYTGFILPIPDNQLVLNCCNQFIDKAKALSIILSNSQVVKLLQKELTAFTIDRQIVRQAGRQAGRQTERYLKKFRWSCVSFLLRLEIKLSLFKNSYQWLMILKFCGANFFLYKKPKSKERKLSKFQGYKFEDRQGQGYIFQPNPYIRVRITTMYICIIYICIYIYIYIYDIYIYDICI